MSQNFSDLTIFSDSKSSIKVFFAEDNRPSKECVVIFSAWAGRQLNSAIGGTYPLLREGIDVVCVQSNCDDWHQNVYTKGIESLKEFLDGTYSSVKGYGSSMGGFGAILYASMLNLDSVLALSPQYTISDDFDKRWRLYNQKIIWHYTMEMASGYSGDIHLIYDPFDVDSKHAALIKKNFSKATICTYEIKYGSHQITHYFNDAGLLKQLLLSFAHSNIHVPAVEKKSNKTYLRTLSLALTKKNKLFSAKAVIIKSIELGDERHSAYRQASDICKRLKDFDGAISYARQAVEAKDNTDASRANHKAHLANLLRLAGKVNNALELVNELLTDEINDASRFIAYTTKTNILLQMQKLKEARDVILKSIELGDERHSAYRQASDICKRLKDFDSAISYARQAVEAKDNTDASRANHKAHLANLLRLAGSPPY